MFFRFYSQASYIYSTAGCDVHRIHRAFKKYMISSKRALLYSVIFMSPLISTERSDALLKNFASIIYSIAQDTGIATVTPMADQDIQQNPKESRSVEALVATSVDKPFAFEYFSEEHIAKKFLNDLTTYVQDLQTYGSQTPPVPLPAPLNLLAEKMSSDITEVHTFFKELQSVCTEADLATIEGTYAYRLYQEMKNKRTAQDALESIAKIKAPQEGWPYVRKASLQNPVPHIQALINWMIDYLGETPWDIPARSLLGSYLEHIKNSTPLSKEISTSVNALRQACFFKPTAQKRLFAHFIEEKNKMPIHFVITYFLLAQPFSEFSTEEALFKNPQSGIALLKYCLASQNSLTDLKDQQQAILSGLIFYLRNDVPFTNDSLSTQASELAISLLLSIYSPKTIPAEAPKWFSTALYSSPWLSAITSLLNLLIKAPPQQQQVSILQIPIGPAPKKDRSQVLAEKITGGARRLSSMHTSFNVVSEQAPKLKSIPATSNPENILKTDVFNKCDEALANIYTAYAQLSSSWQHAYASIPLESVRTIYEELGLSTLGRNQLLHTLFQWGSVRSSNKSLVTFPFVCSTLIIDSLSPNISWDTLIKQAQNNIAAPSQQDFSLPQLLSSAQKHDLLTWPEFWPDRPAAAEDQSWFTFYTVQFLTTELKLLITMARQYPYDPLHASYGRDLERIFRLIKLRQSYSQVIQPLYEHLPPSEEMALLLMRMYPDDQKLYGSSDHIAYIMCNTHLFPQTRRTQDTNVLPFLQALDKALPQEKSKSTSGMHPAVYKMIDLQNEILQWSSQVTPVNQQNSLQAILTSPYRYRSFIGLFAIYTTWASRFLLEDSNRALEALAQVIAHLRNNTSLDTMNLKTILAETIPQNFGLTASPFTLTIIDHIVALLSLKPQPQQKGGAHASLAEAIYSLMETRMKIPDSINESN